MASIYARRNGQIYMRVKGDKVPGKWDSQPTDRGDGKPYRVGEESKAKRYAEAAQRAIDARRAGDPDGASNGPLTLRAYFERWLKDREARGLRSVADDEGRIRNHVLPYIGGMRIDEVRPRHIRDLVRALIALKKTVKDELGNEESVPALAPRTILNVYGVVHTMFRDAETEELIPKNPCVLKRGELPSKTDKDPEWRALATYTINEVQRLISDGTIPVERRVQYALKAIAGLRHGEVAGLRWRHYDSTLEPLGRLLVATSYDTGRTKTEVTRRVPVHATLAKILAAWKLSHWERIYGRKPEPDDLIVPTRNMTTIDATDAGKAFKADLALLGMRVDAGEHRDRGGHDLRAWFITTCQEHGAHRDLLRVVTHPGKGDVVDGYTRATWGALCGEVAKLRVSTLDGEVLPLATQLATAERSAAKRWRKMATPTWRHLLGTATIPFELLATPAPSRKSGSAA